MRQVSLICIVLTSISIGYGQDYNAHFAYERSEVLAHLVASQPVDSLTQFEKVVLDGSDSVCETAEGSDGRSVVSTSLTVSPVTGNDGNSGSV